MIMLKVNDSVLSAMQNSSMADIEKVNLSLTYSKELMQDKADYVFVGVFFALMLGFIIVSYYATVHPIFMVVYILGCIVLGVLAGIFQYLWEQIAGSAYFTGYVTSYMPVANWILTHFVLVIVVIEFVGLFTVFIGHVVRPKEV